MDKLIYVSGPLSGKDNHIGSLSNVKRAVEVAEKLYEKGWYSIVPHLCVFYHKIIKRSKPDYTPTYARWIGQDLVLLSKCDAMFYIAPSPGADAELKFALANNIKVYYHIDDVPKC